MTHKKPGVAIVGLGLIARTHATAYLAKSDVVELVAVCDSDPEVARAFADEFGARPYTDYREVLADESVDVADLILPHSLHREIAIAALDAGKHVLLEKPIAPNYPDSLEIYRHALAAGVHFMVAENTRYIAAYQAIEKALRDGLIGEVIHARTILRSNEKAHLSMPGNWRTRFDLGGGLVLDTGAHSFYLLAWLLGEIESLRATGKKLFALPNEIEDTAEVSGILRSGAHFSCAFTSVSEAPHSERLELYGTEGALFMDQAADPVVKLFQGQYDFAGRALPGVPVALDAWHPGGWHFESVLTEVGDFVDSLVAGRDPLIDSRDCVYAIGVVDAAYRSIRAGEEVVRLDELTRKAIR
ncbi:MAG: Gfo/Idh/MocA family oxidoreductase [Propionibacteriaceae bacterium]|jgi:predicted dehydrogenase|nr:Gfo/Idh/MocA family oxidoreductase [Propionibacteriaceae bacterium]